MQYVTLLQVLYVLARDYIDLLVPLWIELQHDAELLLLAFVQVREIFLYQFHKRELHFGGAKYQLRQCGMSEYQVPDLFARLP